MSPFVVLLLAALVYVVWTVKRGSAARPSRGRGAEPLAARTRRLRDWDGEQPLDASPAPPAAQVWPSEEAEPLRVAARSASPQTAAPPRPAPLTPTPTGSTRTGATGIGSTRTGAMGTRTGSPPTAAAPPASVPTVRAMPDSARAVVAMAPEFARVAPRPGPPAPPRPESRPRVKAPQTHPESRPSPESPHAAAAKTPAARTPAAVRRSDAAPARAAPARTHGPDLAQDTGRAHVAARTPAARTPAAKTPAAGAAAAAAEVTRDGPGKSPRASSDTVAAAGRARH